MMKIRSAPASAARFAIWAPDVFAFVATDTVAVGLSAAARPGGGEEDAVLVEPDALDGLGVDVDALPPRGRGRAPAAPRCGFAWRAGSPKKFSFFVYPKVVKVSSTRTPRAFAAAITERPIEPMMAA